MSPERLTVPDDTSLCHGCRCISQQPDAERIISKSQLFHEEVAIATVGLETAQITERFEKPHRKIQPHRKMAIEKPHGKQPLSMKVAPHPAQ